MDAMRHPSASHPMRHGSVHARGPRLALGPTVSQSKRCNQRVLRPPKLPCQHGTGFRHSLPAQASRTGFPRRLRSQAHPQVRAGVLASGASVEVRSSTALASTAGTPPA